jgi:hypothetical protein
MTPRAAPSRSDEGCGAGGPDACEALSLVGEVPGQRRRAGGAAADVALDADGQAEGVEAP